MAAAASSVRPVDHSAQRPCREVGRTDRRRPERDAFGSAGYRRTLQTDRRHLLSQFEYMDMALKVVGVGSVGTRAWMMLLSGRDDGDPLFLQASKPRNPCWNRMRDAVSSPTPVSG